jgi:hypothetical protein
VDAEAVHGLTTLTKLKFYGETGEDGLPVEQAGEWVLDLSRLTTLTTLRLGGCSAVTDKEVNLLLPEPAEHSWEGGTAPLHLDVLGGVCCALSLQRGCTVRKCERRAQQQAGAHQCVAA